MSHSLGSSDHNLILKTFNTTLFLHIIIGLGIIVFIEIGGYLMFKYFLEIPTEKIFDAKIIFHFMALTTFITIIAVPYDAVINSHENLLTLSIVDIIGALLKLGLAIYLTYTNLNLLILYGFGMFLVQLIQRIIKQQYSVKHYTECQINLKYAKDKKLIKEIMTFIGWNLFGSIAAMSVKQIRSIILNMFFGVRINASEGIAVTASNQVNTISVNLTRAINPQLVKSEGAGDRKRMLDITIISTKFSIYLFSIIAIPVIMELPFLLDVWLKDVPEYAIIFSRLTLISLLLSKFTFEITTALRAVGRIKEFQVVETIVLLLNLPFSYILFKIGYTPEWIYIVAIILSIITSFYRLYIGKKIANLDIKMFLKKGILPTIIPILTALVIGFFIQFYMNQSVERFIISFTLSILSMVLIIRYWGLNEYELNKMKSIIFNIKNKMNAVFRR